MTKELPPNLATKFVSCEIQNAICDGDPVRPFYMGWHPAGPPAVGFYGPEARTVVWVTLKASLPISWTVDRIEVVSGIHWVVRRIKEVTEDGIWYIDFNRGLIKVLHTDQGVTWRHIAQPTFDIGDTVP